MNVLSSWSAPLNLFVSTRELHALVAERTRQMEEHTRQLKIDAQNIRSLTDRAVAAPDKPDNLEGR
jgi:hypothetical protein